MRKIKAQNYKSLAEVHSTVDTSHRQKHKKFLAFLGPAYLVSVGYMDPGNWATDIAGGSQFGYTLIWVLLASNLMALLLQTLSAKLGIVGQMDLAQASRREYPPVINFILWILAEIAIAATDLAEVLGMAIGLQLLFDIPLIWGVTVTIADTFIILILQSYGMRKLEAFIIALVVIIGGSFFMEMLFAKPDLVLLSKGFVPSIPNDTALYIAVGIIGATVMPHNLYLHSALVQTRRIDAKSFQARRSAIRYNIADSTIALNAAFFVNAAILILAASTFYKAGLHEVTEIKEAYVLLSPLLGNELAPILFAVALIAAGQSSTITGTLSGQIVMEGYLNLRITPWLRRLITRMIAIIPAYLVIIFLGEGKTGALLIFSQVILSLQLGFAIIPLIYFTSNRAIMGEHTNRKITQFAAWLIAITIVSLNIQLVINEITSLLASSSPQSLLWWLIWFLMVPAALGSFFLLLYISLKPIIEKRAIRKKTDTLHAKPLHLKRELPALRYKRIAVSIDFSNVDALALSSALVQGGKQAHYLLIHIVESPGALVYGRHIQDKETATDKQVLNKYTNELRAEGYNVDAEIGYGNPKKEITRIVKKNCSDLLVMSAHGHGFIKDLIFGSTVNAVRHRLNIAVLIPKAKDNE